MKITVINGSPKGKESITYHHVLFLEKHFKALDFTYLHIGRNIKKYLNNIDEVIDQMIESDLVLVIYPVYTFVVPYQLMAFFNSLNFHQRKDELKDIYVSQLSTSKHFYDITAYDYVKLQAQSLGMSYLDGVTIDMNDLLIEKGRFRLVSFMDKVIDQVNRKIKYPYYKVQALPLNDFYYEQVPEPDKIKSSVLVIYNGVNYSETLKNMISAFENLCEYEVHRLDLSNVNIRGGCLGCLRCVYTSHCVYKDEYEKMYQDKIHKADVIVYASDIDNHYIHEDFKLLDDRAFYNGHRVNVKKKAVTYLLNGSLTTEFNLKMIIEAKAEVGHMCLLKPVTTESDDILEDIKRLTYDLSYFMKHQPEARSSFYGVGGMKVFRDLVYDMRGLMVEDHKYYKKNNLYDFPRKSYLRNVGFYLMHRLMKHPKMFNKYIGRMNHYILTRYKNVLEDK